MKYLEQHIELIIDMRNKGLSYPDIVANFEKKFKVPLSAEAVRNVYERYSNYYMLDDNTKASEQLIQHYRTKTRLGRTQKENKLVLKQLAKERELSDEFSILLKDTKLYNLSSIKKQVNKEKKKAHITKELLLSDIHFGKKTKEFNLVKARERMKYLTSKVLQEIHLHSKSYNVDELIIACLGDIIESATMHGIESMRSSEFGNSKQVMVAIQSLYEDVMIPLYHTGLPIRFVGVTGNHDRTDVKRTYNNPGEENLTYIIYNTLRMMMNSSGAKNIKYNIPIEPYAIESIYRNKALYEHYDNAAANTNHALRNLMMKRQSQSGVVLDFMRGGHFHEPAIYGRGTIITNGCVPGQDSFAEVLGYSTEATQLLNTYVDTDTRPTCYYQTSMIYLP